MTIRQHSFLVLRKFREGKVKKSRNSVNDPHLLHGTIYGEVNAVADYLSQIAHYMSKTNEYSERGFTHRIYTWRFKDRAIIATLYERENLTDRIHICRTVKDKFLMALCRLLDNAK